ncbi:transcription termination/antitermination protein NusA [Phormidium pseudopriestleyi FRX01]|uniref:Transcription termination/antitermination protein NusA n=1 Tax=Phormidium pseudopriestleyi FRX01 TaxID=1759528 RepID=A0ABS3FW98_9CYAN|nr:transcription termination/antitermination protein NusA [Phormidium pseudopriestleyi]MBO0351389.1 transcription termination/antitermination protein NusA [Phormidium pseudopriestleyi FRX01]
MSMVSLPGLRSLLDTMSQQRSLPPLAVQAALKAALLKGYERYRRTQVRNDEDFPEDYFENFAVKLDLKTEGFRVIATKTVVETVEDSDREIALEAASKKGAKVKLGDRVIVDVTPNQGDFGRLAALQTKTVLTQKLQEQQCKYIQETFGERKGTVLLGKVLKSDARGVVLGVSGGSGHPLVEAELPKYEKLPNDDYQEGAEFKVYLKKVFDRPSSKPLLRVSRATSYLVSGLFSDRVPEIRQATVEIKGVARDSIPTKPDIAPRTKIAVHSLDPEVDPVAACIGKLGEHLNAIAQEIPGEKIEVIPWSDDPATYIANALSPAQVEGAIALDLETQSAEVIVAPDQLAIALGPEDQNLQLAERLTEWKITFKTLPET